MSDWNSMETAPHDRIIVLRGKTDTQARKERSIRAMWDEKYQSFVTMGGWIVIASAWREEQ